MKKTILSSIVSMLALTVLALAPASFAMQSAPLEGVWDSEVTLTDCNGFTLAVFEAFVAYHQGGTLTSTDNTPPTLHGVGLGRWKHLNGQTYSSHFQFFNFNPDGTFSGTQKISTRITVAADGNSYTSIVAFETLDPDGNVVFSGCGSEAATRLQ